jgi:hypothetical protein
VLKPRGKGAQYFASLIIKQNWAGEYMPGIHDLGDSYQIGGAIRLSLVKEAHQA